ncbi:MAG: aminoacyl-tRNA hydrolase [Lachnospiraceae bacterium]
MYIIVGLGNPGAEYQGTRHNMGFMVLDELARKYNISIDTKKHKGLIGKGMIGSQKVVLVKPQTYMNCSGECVRQVQDFYKVSNEEILIIYDDINLEPGKLRIRKKGSAGGHNGIKNIILHLGTQEFPRIRVGVGEKPAKIDLVNYVLGHFQGEDKQKVEEGIENAVAAVRVLIEDGPEAAMNQFNGSK